MQLCTSDDEWGGKLTHCNGQRRSSYAVAHGPEIRPGPYSEIMYDHEMDMFISYIAK